MIAVLVALAVVAAPERAPVVGTLADGTRLIVLPIPGARVSSFRYVVHSGGTSDPADSAGTAHFLEHLIFHGAYDLSEDQLFEGTRGAGVYINAITTPSFTSYVLDAPSPGFSRAASAFVHVVTSPALALAAVDRERAVIAAEGTLSPSVALMDIADQLVFPGMGRRGSVIGTPGTRAGIKREELEAFYASQYLPANTTIVVAGDVKSEEVVAMLEAESRLAPDDGPSPPRDEQGDPRLPLVERVPAPFIMTIHGYEVADLDEATCADLSALAELRLFRAVQVERPIATEVRTECTRMRGRRFLLAVAASGSYEGTELPELLQKAFESLARVPPSADEQRTILGRAKRRLDALWSDPAALATAVAATIGVLPPRVELAPHLEGLVKPPRLDVRKMTEAARALVERKRLQIHVAPFGG